MAFLVVKAASCLVFLAEDVHVEWLKEQFRKDVAYVTSVLCSVGVVVVYVSLM